MNTEILPATPELLERYYGNRLTQSVHAVAAVRDDRVIGVAGYYNDHRRFVLFADFGDEIRKNKRLLVRGARAVLQLIQARRVAVQVLADPAIDGSDKLLEHMGFSPMEGRIYSWQP